MQTAKAGRRLFIGCLVALPYAGLCFPVLYARAKPALFGVPFFYWYQFAWVLITSALMWVVYRQLKSR